MLTADEIEDDIQFWVSSIQMYIKRRDWHGVSDVANDIRELEAKKALLQEQEDDRRKSHTTITAYGVVAEGRNDVTSKEPENVTLTSEIIKRCKSEIYFDKGY